MIESLDKTRTELEQVDKDNMSRIEYNSTKIAEFEKAINQSKVTVQEIRDTVKDCSKKTIGM